MDIAQVCDLELSELASFLAQFDDAVARPMVHKMRAIIGHPVDTGAGYLRLSRSVATLIGGESRRVKMARQLDCDLVGLVEGRFL